MKQNNQSEKIYKVKATFIKDNWRRFKSVNKLFIPIKPVLDTGQPNDFGFKLGIDDFTDAKDLNWSLGIYNKYNTVTSFEVIEHLQNPLLYLHEIHSALTFGGKLYLTTPVKWMFKGKYHFHEFTKEELVFILNEAGFTILEIKRIQAYDLRHFGIRPIIRKIRDILYGQCFYVVAQK